ncbi:hypothetical protein [Metabacillus iocasae]|uniref:Uncharacterized protein n=1 Tax=Priestia iocasae TaxID=2291674 RepID=A0ABS2QXG6_9BACI|nr:hypothetical protein [Metabacillus iocasae]MBM7703647.1 hypothetical protein [Metabacillus iocasae]
MFKRKSLKKKRKKKSEHLGDFLFECLCYLPELLFWPFRLIWYGLRFILRSIDRLFDGLP